MSEQLGQPAHFCVHEDRWGMFLQMRDDVHLMRGDISRMGEKFDKLSTTLTQLAERQATTNGYLAGKKESRGKESGGGVSVHDLFVLVGVGAAVVMGLYQIIVGHLGTSAVAQMVRP